ncbi:MAG: YciK family oxidoreductase, partial [Gammaproteobacteria bacterium]|nr:YciK family oxidoreductase [Gammaproteobacteria bacterium]
QVLASELESEARVRVMSINPGATRTAMRASAYPAENPNTLITPEELVPAYLYLLGPEGHALHGQALNAQ